MDKKVVLSISLDDARDIQRFLRKFASVSITLDLSVQESVYSLLGQLAFALEDFEVCSDEDSKESV